MTEERLIEITTTICKMENYIWPIIYLSKLNSHERGLFLQQVASSKYSNIELCYGIVAFSHDYLKSKNISLMIDSNSNRQNKTHEEDEAEVIEYLDRMMLFDEDMHITGKKRK